MNFFNMANPIVSIIFGILVLIYPKLFSTIAGIYLIVAGLVALGFVKF